MRVLRHFCKASRLRARCGGKDEKEVRSWLRVHPPGLQHAAADIQQAQELLAAWEQECATPQRQLPQPIAKERD